MHPSHLIRQVQQADPEALQYVYNHCRAYCLRRLGSSTTCSLVDAEDIFMDALLIFRENVMTGKLTKVDHLRAYLYRVCENRYREQQRCQQRERQAENTVRAFLYESNPALPDDLPQKKTVVMQAFRYLGEHCRQVLHYYYFDHLTLEEIAKKTNLANSNVAKVTKSRCYKKWVEAVAALKKKWLKYANG